MRLLRRTLKTILTLLIALAVIASAVGFSILLTHATGVVGLLTIAATFTTAGMWGVFVARQAPKKLAMNTYAVSATAIGVFCASIAVSILLAGTSPEWRLGARQLAHPGRAVLSFAAYALVFLVVGLPLLDRRIRQGKLDIRPDTPEQAKIRPARNADRKTYRMD